MNIHSRESNSVQVWVMIVLEKDPYGSGTPSNESQASSRQAKKGPEMSESGETLCCLFSWFMPELGCCLGCHPHFYRLPCSISISLDSFGLPFQHFSFLFLCLSRGSQSSSLVWAFAHFLQEANLNISLICQGVLSLSGDSCKINAALVAT